MPPKLNLTSISSWNDFKKSLAQLSKKEKGDAFELLTKHYLAYNPVYRNKLKQVWLYNEVRPSLLKKLNLPAKDQGIDLLAETSEGEYWAIQCKYLQDEDQRLSHRKISTFVSLSRGIAKGISYCLVCTTVDEYASLYKRNPHIGFCRSDEFNKLDKAFFDWLRKRLAGKETDLKPFSPKPHQAKALKEARQYFLKEKNKRGKLVFPCGAGKSLTGYWISRDFKSKHVLVAVPSLSLVKQTLEVYLRESNAHGDKTEWLCVCSDEGIGRNDDIAIHTQDIGVPCVTDRTAITAWLKKHQDKKAIVFTTYQSGKIIAECSKKAKFRYDLGILDEAHKTVGEKDKPFSHLLFDKNIQIEKRIFMTATERRYAGSSDAILSMDDPDMYGETFATLSFKEAIASGILSDYKIITLFVDDKEVKELIKKNAYVKPTGKAWSEETEARTLASLLALRKAMKQFPIKHAVSFHSSIKKSEAFCDSQALFDKGFPQFGNVPAYHVSGAMDTAKRSKIVDEFAAMRKAIITNAKCLTEGVDVPNIDGVLFADPRKSTVDIVQAVGRALRKSPGKEYGYVILPVFTHSTKKEEIIDSEEFSELLTTLRALAANDERIIEYFRALSQGKKIKKNDSPIQFSIDEKLAERLNEKDLLTKLQLTVWNKLAKLSWRPFEEARDYVRSLNFNNVSEWNKYCISGNKPIDIPAIPRRNYKNLGWVSWGDWLGTGTVASYLREYKSYKEARSYVHTLKIKSHKEWMEYCKSGNKSGNKPGNIPASPDRIYMNKGWVSWGDWFGTGTIANQAKQYRDYYKALAYVRTLNLKNQAEWFEFCKSNKKPDDIPYSPHNIYKNNGWISWGYWLGTGTIASSSMKFRSFKKAKKFVHSLKIKNGGKWREYCKSGNKPFDIPANPDRAYKNLGWVSWGDWLGTGTVASYLREYKSYKEARSYVRTLKIKSHKEWMEYCKSGNKPENIPANPLTTYKKSGWKNWGDWLGTETVANYNKEYKTFKEARNFAHSIGLKSGSEWQKYCQSGKKPEDIPASPRSTYKNEGWVSMGDWLGTGTVAATLKQYKSFKQARLYVRTLNLKSKSDWEGYCKTGKKPANIPACPYKVYKNKGWKGWAEWLGKK